MFPMAMRYVDPNNPQHKINVLEGQLALANAAIARVQALCESRQAQITAQGDTHATTVDAEALWPAEVLNALRDAG